MHFIISNAFIDEGNQPYLNFNLNLAMGSRCSVEPSPIFSHGHGQRGMGIVLVQPSILVSLENKIEPGIKG